MFTPSLLPIIQLSLFLILTTSLTTTYSSIIKTSKKTSHFIDNHNRERFFHGVNAVYKIHPFHPIPPNYDILHPGSTWDPEYSLNEIDAVLLSNWGFNVVRLGVMWSGVEPIEGVYNSSYIGEIKKIVTALKEEGVYTIIDMHQDVFSRDFCGNGFPSWVAQNLVNASNAKEFPLPAHDPITEKDEDGNPTEEKCLENDFVSYYFSDSVSKSFQGVYDNVNGILDKFGDFWEMVVEEFKDEEYVLGYELINEPWAGDIFTSPLQVFTVENKLLKPFYQKLHDRIRAIDTQHIVFYEPVTYDAWPVQFDENPIGGVDGEYDDRSALSYHIYCPIAGTDYTPVIIKLECQIVDVDFFYQRNRDVKRLGGGGMLTEFGSLSDSDLDLAEINQILRLADDNLVSHVYWQYKDYHDLTSTGDGGISFFPGGVLQKDKVRVLSRIYAQAVAGITNVMKFHDDEPRFELSYTPDNFGNDDAETRTTYVRLNREFHFAGDDDSGDDGDGNRIFGLNVDFAIRPDNVDLKVDCTLDGRYVKVVHAQRDKDVAIGEGDIAFNINPCTRKGFCSCHNEDLNMQKTQDIIAGAIAANAGAKVAA